MKTILRNVFSFILISIITINISACSILNLEMDNDLSKGMNITSSDNKYSITIPKTWSTKQILNPAANLNASQMLKEQYIIGLTESKELFTEGLTLKDYSELVINNMKTALKNFDAKSPIEIKIDNKQAYQYIVTGELNKVKISYIITTIEGKDSFYTINTWTLYNKYEENNKLLKNITNTFKENKNTSSNKTTNGSDNKNQNNKIFKSNDNLTTISATDKWENFKSINTDASLSIANPKENKYLIIITESKKDFSSDMTLKDYSEFMMENSKKDKNGVISPVTLKVNNYDSISYKYTGEVNKLKITYILSAIETKNNYHQVIAWTTTTNYTKYESELTKLITSFQEKDK